MEELTIESLKKNAKRYRLNASMFNGLSASSSYANPVSHGKQLAIFTLSLLTFTEEESIKKFLNNELPKLTKQDLLEMFEWKALNYLELSSSIRAILFDSKIDLTNLDIQFLYVFTTKLYNDGIKSSKKYKNEPLTNVVTNLLSEKYMDSKIKARIATALLEIDYLDYFNPNDYKKELFEILINTN